MSSAAIYQDLDLANLDTFEGFELIGGAASGWTGFSVSTAGDVNGDGVADMMMGAYAATPSIDPSRTQAGVTYVFFGRPNVNGIPNFGSTVYLNAFTTGASSGFRVFGASNFDNCGKAVSSAGDVNSDGVDDMLISANMASPPPIGATGYRFGAGIIYLIFGRNVAGGAPAFVDIDLRTTFDSPSLLGYRILGAQGSTYAGSSVSAAGDVNGDGYGDVIISNYLANSAPNSTATRTYGGVAYIIFGAESSPSIAPSPVDLATFYNYTNKGFRVLGAHGSDYMSACVGGGGDVNGDGLDDVVMGAYQARGTAGISYVIFGRNVTATGIPFTPLDLLSFNTPTTLGFRILGAGDNDFSGYSVKMAGDVNGDGVCDLIVGAWTADPPAVNFVSRLDAGMTFVVFGRKLNVGEYFGDVYLSTFTVGSAAGFSILGAAYGDNSGYSVSGAGDVNRDGVDDMLVGAYNADPPALVSGSSAGIAFVIFGRRADYSNIDLISYNTPSGATTGYRILGAVVLGQMSFSLSNAGDVNDDGFDDVIVSSWQTVDGGTNGNNIPEAVVIFGAAAAPTSQPSARPSGQPSLQPSAQPSRQPTSRPSAQPSSQPSSRPSRQPVSHPTSRPSGQPSGQPSAQPVSRPTSQPSTQPSGQPSAQPSLQPSSRPSTQPVGIPTSQPSIRPSAMPSSEPTDQPSSLPTNQPSAQPSAQPSEQPSSWPSAKPSSVPTSSPSSQPSVQPSVTPTCTPSAQPTNRPSGLPSAQPSTAPSSAPTTAPSAQPSTQPSSKPSAVPSAQPSRAPSVRPSSAPSSQPSSRPSSRPSAQPSGQPSLQPTARPSSCPSAQPSAQPSRRPSRQPSSQSSTVPTAIPTSTATNSWNPPLNQLFTVNTADYVGGAWQGSVWVCGVAVTTRTASCVLVDASSGAETSQYVFAWDSVRSVMDTDDPNRVVITSYSTITTFTTTTGTVNSVYASCTTQSSQLTCSVKSFRDATFLSASFVPYPNKVVYVGLYNVHPSIVIVDVTYGTVQSYIYTAYNMKSLTLSQVHSPPNFVGSFVAGSCVRNTGTPANYIVAGMLRTDNGGVSGMSLSPVSGVILSTTDLVNAMELEVTGPDSFIAGGLALSTDSSAGVHGYLLRVNALYNTVQYCVRYVSATNVHGRALSATVASHSGVRAMVLYNAALFVVLECTSQTLHQSVSLLKVSTSNGVIMKQVHIAPHTANMTCTDITTGESYVFIVCNVHNTTHIYPILLRSSHDLAVDALPMGLHFTNITFHGKNVPFQSSVLEFTATPTSILVTDSSEDIVDAGPTRQPSWSPTVIPSAQPSSSPSAQPSSSPTAAPSVSAHPTSQPSTSGPTNTPKPSAAPTARPTPLPTISPTACPSATPSVAPSTRPSTAPSPRPSLTPTTVPTVRPTYQPTIAHTTAPLTQPTFKPTTKPTRLPDTNSTTGNRNNTPSYAIGLSVGGGLCVALVGFVVYKYHLHQAEEKDRKRRWEAFCAREAAAAAAEERSRHVSAMFADSSSEDESVSMSGSVSEARSESRSAESDSETERREATTVVRGAPRGANAVSVPLNSACSSSVLLSSLHSSERSEQSVYSEWSEYSGIGRRQERDDYSHGDDGYYSEHSESQESGALNWRRRRSGRRSGSSTRSDNTENSSTRSSNIDHIMDDLFAFHDTSEFGTSNYGGDYGSEGYGSDNGSVSGSGTIMGDDYH